MFAKGLRLLYLVNSSCKPSHITDLFVREIIASGTRLVQNSSLLVTTPTGPAIILVARLAIADRKAKHRFPIACSSTIRMGLFRMSPLNPESPVFRDLDWVSCVATSTVTDGSTFMSPMTRQPINCGSTIKMAPFPMKLYCVVVLVMPTDSSKVAWGLMPLTLMVMEMMT